MFLNIFRFLYNRYICATNDTCTYVVLSWSNLLLLGFIHDDKQLHLFPKFRHSPFNVKLERFLLCWLAVVPLASAKNLSP